MPARLLPYIVCLIIAALSARVEGRSVQVQVQDMIRGYDLGNTVAAIYILDLNDKTELASINADRLMMPASNMKLITTAAALEIFEPDFKFATKLCLTSDSDTDGPPDTIVLVRGDGDPAFGDPKVLEKHELEPEQLLGEWVDAAKKAGVANVDQLIVDDRVFDRQFVHPSWPGDQLTRHYCAQVAGINFHNNVVHVYPLPRKIGKTPRIVLRPIAPFAQTSNFAVTAAKDSFWIDRKLGTNLFKFGGGVATRRSEPLRITVHDPSIYFAHLLADRLTKAGIPVAETRRVGDGEILPDGRVLYEARTTLHEVLTRCNSQSQNLYAEALLKRMGRAYTGAPGTWSNGASAVRHFLGKRLGTAAAVLSIADGSGLSRDNHVTTRLVVKLLQNMYEDRKLGFDYIQTLAVGGETGTLKKRFRRPLTGKVYAKSGYINGVSALSGYLLLPGAEPGAPHHAIAFSLVFNEINKPVPISTVTTVQERIVALVDQAYQPIEMAAP